MRGSAEETVSKYLITLILRLLKNVHTLTLGVMIYTIYYSGDVHVS